jgi:hypothetical protein
MTTPDFSALAPYISEWGLPSVSARIEKRVTSSIEELQGFHAAMLPRLQEIIEFLNQFPLNEIPEEHQPLKNAALFMLHAERPVTKWQTPILADALDPRHFNMKKSFIDS